MGPAVLAGIVAAAEERGYRRGMLEGKRTLIVAIERAQKPPLT